MKLFQQYVKQQSASAAAGLLLLLLGGSLILLPTTTTSFVVRPPLPPTTTKISIRTTSSSSSTVAVAPTPSSSSSALLFSPVSSTTTTSSSSSCSRRNSATALLMTEENKVPPQPTNFREAEILGLKLMQDGKYEEALQVFQKALKLPGSRQDVVRTKLLSGPSPVGGSMGGFDSQQVLTLDEFELQAAHYNMACAQAQLGRVELSLQSLRTAFENGFDNYTTVRSDPDLEPLRRTSESAATLFEELMAEYEPKNKKGGGGGGAPFNPFGLFGGKN